MYRIVTTADARQGCAVSRGAASGCSLRDCVEAKGPRICVFAVAGTISTAGLVVSNPFITIRGETAPGEGVQLSAAGKDLEASGACSVLSVRTHDVVIRGLRIRAAGSGSADTDKAIEVTNYYGPVGCGKGLGSQDVHHVVLDHNSLYWGRDAIVDIYGTASPPAFRATAQRELTLSYNVLAEGIEKSEAGGSRGSLVGGGGNAGEYMLNVDFHHNLFASNGYRNPSYGAKRGRFVNNIIYDAKWWGSEFRGGVSADIISNLYRTGPSTRRRYRPISVYELDGNAEGALGTPSHYVTGNVSDYRGMSDDGSRNWSSGIIGGAARFDTDVNATTVSFVQRFRRVTPLPTSATGVPISVEPAAALTRSLLASGGVGASRRLDCGGRWVAVRDAADAKVVRDVLDRSGAVRGARIPRPSDPALPSISETCRPEARDNSRCACADADGDGIPDYWEAAFCGSPVGCAALGATVMPPWTDLEAFLSGAKEAP